MQMPKLNWMPKAGSEPIIQGEKPHINYNIIPGVVYTWPEVASVGFTEEQLKEKGIAYNNGKFPFSASGRVRASGDTEGFSKY